MGELNPVEIPLVINKICSYLPLKELKVCRQVSKSWLNQSLPLVRNKIGEKSFDTCFASLTQASSIRNFIRVAEASGDNFPITKYRIVMMWKTYNAQEEETLLCDLLHQISPIVTELEIPYVWGSNLFTTVKPENFPFPKLKRLILRLCFYGDVLHEDGDAGVILEVLSSIIEMAPNLESIVFTTLIRSEGTLPKFVQCLENVNNPRFSDLQITVPWETPTCDRLISLGLKLTSLTLTIDDGYSGAENFARFLESLKDTLLHLTIRVRRESRDENRAKLSLEFPSLPNLTSLKVEINSFSGWRENTVKFENVCYQKQFPSLRRLQISEQVQNWEDFVTPGKPFPTLEELRFGPEEDEAEKLFLVGRVFPNIRKLEIPAIKSVFDAVCKYLPNIEDLTLTTGGFPIIDHLITGLPKETCDRFSESVCNWAEFDYPFDIKSCPISWLEKLTTLRLHLNRKEGHPVEITELSCVLVLMKLENLNRLDFGGRPTHDIRSDVMDMIRTKFTVT